jgi:hypothetical protein
MWDWQSRLRRGLQKEELAAPLFLGQGVHVALDHFYSMPEQERSLPLLTGAYILWIQKRVERMKEYGGPLWESEQDMVSDMRALGLGMLEHYWLWSRKADEEWDFLSTEELFNVPLPIFGESVVKRGSRMLKQLLGKDELRFAGRFDGVVRNRTTGKLYLLEFKTTKSLYNMRWTMRGIQGTAYIYAAREVYGSEIAGVMYRALVKKVPADPVPLKRGGYSKAKDQKTTFLWLKNYFEIEAAVRNVDVKVVFRENESLLRLFAGENKEADFFDQTLVHRTQAEIDSVMRALSILGQEMIDPNVPIFPVPGFHCNWCDYGDPCTLKNKGGDVEALLEAQYAPRDYWEQASDSD